MRQFRNREINIIALSTAFLTACSWITVPGAIPYTLQSFGVFTVAALFGGKCGFLTVLVYMLLGAAGIPVFSGGRAGVGILFSETGGYLFGFLIGAFVCGIICGKKKSTAATIAAMLLGLALCYACACLWVLIFYYELREDSVLFAVFARYVIPFVIPDLIKLVLSVFAVKAIRKRKIIN